MAHTSLITDMHAHSRYVLIDHGFLGLIQVDGTEVTCQVTSQKSVTCDVGYPALKRKQQVQLGFHPRTHCSPCLLNTSANSPTHHLLHHVSPFDRHHTLTGCIFGGSFRNVNVFHKLLIKNGISPM